MLHGKKPRGNVLVLAPPNCFVWKLIAGGEVRVQKGFHISVQVPNKDEVGTVVADFKVSAHQRLQILWEVW